MDHLDDLFEDEPKKKKNGSGFPGRRWGLIFIKLVIVLVGIYFLIEFTLERQFPFVSEPAIVIDFAQEDPRFLDNFHIETNCYPAFNGEAQCYMDSAENVTIEPGRGLVLRAIYEGTDEEGNPLITSGRVDTRDFFETSCGKYEVQVQVPYGAGVFAAVWLREPDYLQADPSLVNPIINILEFQGGMLDRAHFNFHTNQTLARAAYSENAQSVTIDDFPIRRRTIVLEWTNEYAMYWVDGRLYHGLSAEEVDGWNTHPMHLILNLAMGGNWAEAIAARNDWNTWRGIALREVGHEWEMVVESFRYYPLKDPSRCSDT